MKKKLIVASLAVLIFATAPTFACCGDASLGEQIVQQATLIDQYSTQADQLQQQIAMLQNAYANSVGLPIQAWASAQSHLNELTGLLQNTQGITYASQNLLGQVQQQYGDGASLLPNYGQQLTTWNQNMMAQISSVLQQYNLHTNNATAAQSALQQIMNASQSAQGRMQVLQAGNQIAGIAVNELHNLQQIVMSGNQAQLNYLANKSAQEQQDRMKAQQFLRKAVGSY